MAKLNFDSSAVEPNAGGEYTPLPPGEYRLMVAESEMKPTKALTGLLLKAKMEVLEGEYKGRFLFVNYNIKNPSPEAEKIGQGQLSALCHACGCVGMVEDSSELHGIPFMAKIGVKPPKGEYGPSNYITSYVMPEAKKNKSKTKAAKVEAEEVSLEDDLIPF